MKYLLLFLFPLAAIAASIGLSPPYSSRNTIPTNLVFWGLASAASGVGNGNPVSTWTDSSTRGHDATQTGGQRPTYSSNVDGHQALTFDHLNTNHMLLPNVQDLNITGDITITCWVRTTSNTELQLILGGYNPLTPFEGYALALNVTAGSRVSGYSGGSQAWREASSGFVASAWMHAAVTIIGGVSSVYINAVPAIDTLASPNSWAAQRAIGAVADGTFPFRGSLRDLRIYNGGLSRPQIETIYAENRD